MRNPLFRFSVPAFPVITLLFVSSGLFASGQTNHRTITPKFYYSSIPVSYQERIFLWMRNSYLNANSEFAHAFKTQDDFRFSSVAYSSSSESLALFTPGEIPSSGDPAAYSGSESDESEKILVVLVDAYGTQNYSKVIITDVDMEQSILIAKDLFDKLPVGVYTVVASSANDLISQKLIIQ